MQPELDRVKSDLLTIEKAIGVAPAFGPEWVQWLRRDTRLYLLWGVPALILIGSAFVTFDDTQRHLGLLSVQWIGIVVAAFLLGILAIVNRTMSGRHGRPAGLVREYKRITAATWGLLVPISFYFVWGQQYAIGGEAFTAGLWILSGSTIFMLALVMRVWVFIGWALPLLAFGLCQPLIRRDHAALWLGITMITGALLCSIIQTWQLRHVGEQHASD